MSTLPPRASALLTSAAAAALLLGPAGTSPAHAATASTAKETPRPVTRVVVADGTAGALTVHHAATGRRLLEATLPGPASLVTLGDGRHVAAVIGAAGKVQLVDSGAWTEPHDDHTHSYLLAPGLAGQPLTADRPSHVVPHGDEVVVFGDGSGAADRYSLQGLLAGTGTPATIRGAFPHHGVGVTFGEGLLLSAAPSAGARPDTVLHVDRTGRELARFTGCPALHGETSGADWAAFGCLDGTLLIEGATPRARKLAYPAGLTGRVGTWNRTGSGRHLVGALGTTGVLTVDRRAGTQHYTPLAGTVHAVKTDGASSSAIALTRDGQVHRLSAGTGAVRSSAQAIQPFTAPTGQPSPKLAVSRGRIAVSDPARGTVTVLRARDLSRVTSFRVPGTPTQVALTGELPGAE